MPAIPYIIMGGAQVAGSVIASHGQSTAADKQAEAIQKGIDLQREMYQQDRADFAPYRGLGAGAVGNLAYLGGINLPAQASDTAVAATQQPTHTTRGGEVLPSRTRPPDAPVISHAVPRGSSSLADLGTPSTDAVTPTASRARVRAPDGTVRLIPISDLPNALAAGGQQVA